MNKMNPPSAGSAEGVSYRPHCRAYLSGREGNSGPGKKFPRSGKEPTLNTRIVVTLL
jgi:hypothetical protein